MSPTQTRPKRRGSIAAAALAGAVLVATGCGSSSDSSASKLSLKITESGQKVTIDAPKSVKGGLVDLQVTNGGKQPHAVQLARIEGKHTAAEAAKVIGSNSDVTPDWLRAEGGTSTVEGGKAGTATLNLVAGKYVAVDLQSGPSAAPAEFTVKDGSEGDLPSTDATVTGVENGKDSYSWEADGLKAGTNTITFKAEGDEALHFVGAFRITGKHSEADVKKALGGGRPPSWVDQASFTNTAVLDGGLSQVTDLTLKQPGTWVLFCPLTDREGGKPHFLEGMLKEVQVPKG